MAFELYVNFWLDCTVRMGMLQFSGWISKNCSFQWQFFKKNFCTSLPKSGAQIFLIYHCTIYQVNRSHFCWDNKYILCVQVKDQEAVTSEAVQCIQQTITALQKVSVSPFGHLCKSPLPLSTPAFNPVPLQRRVESRTHPMCQMLH